jgi:hypothetical protein
MPGLELQLMTSIAAMAAGWVVIDRLARRALKSVPMTRRNGERVRGRRAG